MLAFPLFQGLVVTTLGLDALACVRVLVDLELTGLAAGLFSQSDWCTSTDRLWVKNGYDVAQAVAVLREQTTELFFKFDFALKAIIVFEGLKFGQLSSQLLLQRTEFSKSGHLSLLYMVPRV